MERIKQALEKARREAVPAGALSGGAVARGSARSAPQIAGETIVHSQTRVVELAPSLMSRNRIVAFDRASPQSTAFDILRTRVLQKMDANGWRTLAITSPTPGSGKTVVSINLAMAIAHKTDRTAMLVDFDLRRPKIAGYLGLSPGTSLNDVLKGEAAVPEALLNPGIARLAIMPADKPELGPAELLSSGRVKALVGELRERYADRIVLFDLPPLLGTDDALAVLPQIDCVLVVVGDGETTRAELEESLRQLPPTNLIGTVLNKSDTPGRNYY